MVKGLGLYLRSFLCVGGWWGPRVRAKEFWGRFHHCIQIR